MQVKLKDIIYTVPDKKYQIKNSEIQSKGSFPVVDQSSTMSGFYDIDKCFDKGECILFADHTSRIFYMGQKFIIGCDGMKIIKIEDDLDINQKFVYFALCNNYHGDGKWRRHFGDFQNCTIDLPDRKIQDKIAEILSGIDEQINRNNEVVKKLQVLAQSTYSRWFNQFEFPNEDGLPYKSNGGKMVWNDELKREIPDGWSTILVGNATKCCLGGTPSRDKIEYWNGNINWINSGEVANFPIIETKEKITESGLQYSATEIMPPKTAIISITGNIRFSINTIPCCANQSVVGVFETEKLPISYLYFVLLENEQKYVKQMTGAIQKHINKDIIEKTTILVPDNQVIQQYNNIVDTIIEQILILSRQTFELNKLKSCILPLLINGQLKL